MAPFYGWGSNGSRLRATTRRQFPLAARDSIPVVVLKNGEPERSYVLAELFNMCLKGSGIPDCWKVSSLVYVFRNVGERSTAKNYHPVSLLSVVSKVFDTGFQQVWGLLELWHLIYLRLLTGFGILVFFTNLSLMEVQVRYLVLFPLSSVIDGFGWFWMVTRISS